MFWPNLFVVFVLFSDSDKLLSPQMAEFESIMWLAHKFCFDVQGDRPEIAAETIYQLALISCHYEEEDEFNVVDVKKSWPATTPFTKLPTIKMTTNEEKANINMPLMSRDSKES